MSRPGRALVVTCVAIVLIAAVLPGMSGLLAACLEPAWTLVAFAPVLVEPAPDATTAPVRDLVLVPSGLRAPPARPA